MENSLREIEVLNNGILANFVPNHITHFSVYDLVQLSCVFPMGVFCRIKKYGRMFIGTVALDANFFVLVSF